MFLWEAILLGAELRGKGTGHFHWNETCSCSLGAAAEAVGIISKSRPYGGDFRGRVYPEMVVRWPILDRKIQCPERTTEHPLSGVIEHLTFRRTREEVAQWLRPIEESFAAQEEKKIAEQVSVAE